MNFRRFSITHSGCTERECKPNETIFEEHTKMFESRISAGATEKFTLVGKISRKNSCPILWYGRTYQKSALKNSANWQKKVKQLHKFSNPCLDDHQFKKEELESEGELSEVCSQTVLKCLYLARIGRPDSLWSLVSKQTGSCGPQKWTQACDRRLARLISYIHHTQDYRQYCHVGNTAQRCRLGLFQDSDFAGNLEDSKSTSGGILRLFGSRTFVPVNWMCKTQTSVSHSFTESEIIFQMLV